MEAEMETSSSFLDPEDLSIREQYRRYGSVSKFNEPGLLYDGTNIHSPTNTALILENIKQEVQSFDYEGTPVKMQSASKRRSSVDSHGILEAEVGVNSIHQLGGQSLKACKIESDSLADVGETTFALFASLLDSALQGA